MIYIGYPNSEFKLLWKETSKHTVTSICAAKDSDLVYAGTMKGHILCLCFTDPEFCLKTIDSINGKSVIAISAHHHIKTK